MVAFKLFNYRLTSRKAARLVIAAVGLILLALISAQSNSGAEADVESPGSLLLTLKPFAVGLEEPVSITNAGSGDDRLFVNEKAGRIMIVQADGSVRLQPFLDIRDRVADSGEEGFLGLAFHPDYGSNGSFYVNYTNMTGGVRRTRISRFIVSDDPNTADPDSEEILLTVVQPFSNHNAGDIHFGPDGYLYIPLGDGGGGGDQDNNAQNLGTLLGKILRIDPDSTVGNFPADCRGDGTGSYSIPSDNPFRNGMGGACDEIWALGLRNPWRSSFDRSTGDFYIGDVGQNAWEEINFQPADSIGGENYGWRCYEGNHEYNASGCESKENFTFPVFEYAHGERPCAASVTGGYVYRGNRYSNISGRYFLADFCKGTFWDLERVGDSWLAAEHSHLKKPGYSAFGQDSRGELYLANLYDGSIYILDAGFEVVGYIPIVIMKVP